MSHYYGIFILILLFTVAGLLLKVYGDSKVKRNLRAAIEDERKKTNRLVKNQEREFNARIAVEKCKLQQQFGVNPTRVEEEKNIKRFNTPRHISTINKTTRRHISNSDDGDVTGLVNALIMTDVLTDNNSPRGNYSDESSNSSCLSDSGGSDCSCSCGGD